MRYHYFYQNSKNEALDGWVTAKDRNDAYSQLKKQGIKPIKVVGRDPIGWKRWTSIAVLGAAVAVLAVFFLQDRIRDRREAYAEEDRAQVYGDPVLLRELAADGWRKALGNEGDAWFARHARPGLMCDCNGKIDSVVLTAIPIRIENSDTPEVSKMKRLINGMKREYAQYVNAGGSSNDYKSLCDERLRTEMGIVANMEREFKALENRLLKGDKIKAAEEWAKKNALLRSMGLPTVIMPETEEY